MNALTLFEAEIIAPMTTDEAFDWKQRVGSTANQLRTLLDEGYERGAWEALGYANWTDCINALAEEYGFTARRLWQLHAANQTEKLLNNCSVGEIPESQLRPLTILPVDQRRYAWEYANETAPNGKVTAAHVETVARRFVAPVEPDENEQLLEDLPGEEAGYDWTDEEPFHAAAISNGAPGKMAVHYSSDKMDWETPQELFALINDEFHFTLDVCATPMTAKCPAYFTPEDDGLKQDWNKHTCWMNPPYGDEISDWASKAYDEAQKGATVVCLVPARVDTAWWWENCIHGEIRFLKGRLKFKQNGNEESGAPFPSAVVVFAPGIAPHTVWWDWKRNLRF